MDERQISAHQLKREVSFALWDLQLDDDEPESVVRRMLWRLWLIADGAEL